jgi:hypothetical protein
MNTTRIFVNPDIAEVESFKNRYYFSISCLIGCVGFAVILF